MMRLPIRYPLFLLMMLGLAPSCAASSDDGSSVGDATPTPESSAGRAAATSVRTADQVRPIRAPVVVSVSGPSSVAVGDTVELEIEVEQRVVGTDAELSIELPEGAALVEGELVETLPGDVALVHRRLVVDLPEGVPQKDIQVAVNAAGPNYGAHAQAHYRFGREAPMLPVPPRVGVPVTVHGVSLGNSIPLGT